MMITSDSVEEIETISISDFGFILGTIMIGAFISAGILIISVEVSEFFLGKIYSKN